jgi:hypothetical protein
VQKKLHDDWIIEERSEIESLKNTKYLQNLISLSKKPYSAIAQELILKCIIVF